MRTACFKETYTIINFLSHGGLDFKIPKQDFCGKCEEILVKLSRQLHVLIGLHNIQHVVNSWLSQEQGIFFSDPNI